jgi:gamma-glutamyl hercynylcysteine S-oxide hydrolase
VCRHLAYLGPPVSLASVLVEPEWSLLRQSWSPRQQQHGAVNADGFGVGWYAAGDPVPARYRRDRPIWADDAFADLARVVTSSSFVAAVRSASPGMAAGETAAAPMVRGRWLFSLNGVVKGYPESAAGLAATLPADRLLNLEAGTDTALLWALVSTRLEAGAALGDALAEVVALVEENTEARLNLLLSDGVSVAATVVGNSLSVLADGQRTIVASEPHDDDPAWVAVSDRSLVLATATEVTVSPLDR